ncbi:MAG: patatin-like phospholipase family protein [Patescibacteria group bacterium]|jgi:predicted patatin/cPLA2 family phospholipase|nr:patatin-like phospholipase family protein [Patescibacteria group bacterium]
MPKQDNEVIEHLLARKESKNKDGYKIGLIIEGGGMRGSFSGGVMVGLEKLGLTECFDYIYASSSGSCAGAYFLSKQTELGASIYYKDLDGYKFIKPWKVSKAADIDYLCDTIFRHKKKLDTGKVKRSDSIFKIFVADAVNGNCKYYTNKDDVDLIQVIKASCALPAFYNKPVTIGSNELMDGRIGKSLPIEDAITDGCTDVLVVTTVPENYREKPGGFLATLFKKYLMRDLPFQYRKKYYSDRHSDYNESLDVVFGRINVHRKINIYTISPQQLFSKFESHQKKLKKIVGLGTLEAVDAFSLEKQ